MSMDKVLEIIDKKSNRVMRKVIKRNLDAWERGYTDALDEMEDAVEALKGEQE